VFKRTILSPAKAALCTSLTVARVAYAETIKDRHRSWITLRQGIRIIDERKALPR
jgi:hypothetical protein